MSRFFSRLRQSNKTFFVSGTILFYLERERKIQKERDRSRYTETLEGGREKERVQTFYFVNKIAATFLALNLQSVFTILHELNFKKQLTCFRFKILHKSFFNLICGGL